MYNKLLYNIYKVVWEGHSRGRAGSRVIESAREAEHGASTACAASWATTGVVHAEAAQAGPSCTRDVCKLAAPCVAGHAVSAGAETWAGRGGVAAPDRPPPATRPCAEGAPPEGTRALPCSSGASGAAAPPAAARAAAPGIPRGVTGLDQALTSLGPAGGTQLRAATTSGASRWSRTIAGTESERPWAGAIVAKVAAEGAASEPLRVGPAEAERLGVASPPLRGGSQEPRGTGSAAPRPIGWAYYYYYYYYYDYLLLSLLLLLLLLLLRS